MFELDFSSPGATITTFLRVVNAVLRRNNVVILAAQNDERVVLLSLQIVALAGFSEALGQSIVLFANQVKPRRFALSLVISSLLFVFNYAVLVTSVWLIATYIFGEQQPVANVLRAVGLGYAPLLLGFLGIIPYFGNGILNILYLWTVVTVVLTVSLKYSFTLSEAVVCVALGALVVQSVRATIGRPVVRLTRGVRDWAAGTELETNFRKLLNNFTGDD